jgi:ATP-dependent Clp protease adapter protein ClpS
MDGYECYTRRRGPYVTIDRDPEDRGPADSTDDSRLYEVRIIDNDYNTYQQVIDVTMMALGIDRDQAFVIAWEVDHAGSCVVAVAPQRPAESIADAIRSIGIEVQVNPVAGHVS